MTDIQQDAAIMLAEALLLYARLKLTDAGGLDVEKSIEIVRSLLKRIEAFNESVREERVT